MNDLARVRSATAGIDLARQHRNEMIVAARERGHTWQAIAEAAGMTRQGVMKIAKQQQ